MHRLAASLHLRFAPTYFLLPPPPTPLPLYRCLPSPYLPPPDAILAQFLKLANLPPTIKTLPDFLVHSFVLRCEKLAEAYLALSSYANLYLFLACIKVGVVPALRGPRGKARLEAYPGVPFPARK